MLARSGVKTDLTLCCAILASMLCGFTSTPITPRNSCVPCWCHAYSETEKIENRKKFANRLIASGRPQGSPVCEPIGITVSFPDHLGVRLVKVVHKNTAVYS